MRIPATLAALGFLAACGSGPAEETASVDSDTTTEASGDEGLTDYEEAYKEKVKDRVRKSVVKSLMKDHGITQAQAECLSDLGFATMSSPKSDPNARSRVETCDVDPDEVLR
ncbi:MAG: hypothetical protein KDE32_15040 [Novosphingobium sp.]|nr:hypothetical protein [Novosphingobium sp.]